MNIYPIFGVLILFGISAMLLAGYTGRRRDKGGVVTDDVASREHRKEPSVSDVCGRIICSALKCLAENDVIGACRNRRTGIASIEILRKKLHTGDLTYEGLEGRKRVYIEYMADSTEKIGELSKNIVTAGNYSLSVAEKCDLKALHDYILQTLEGECSEEDVEDRAEKCSEVRDFIGHLISEYYQKGRQDVTDENSTSYSFLILLYYLHSFAGSYYHVVSHSRRM